MYFGQVCRENLDKNAGADTCPAPLADNARCPRRPWPVEYSLSSVTDSGSEPTFSGKTSPM